MAVGGNRRRAGRKEKYGWMEERRITEWCKRYMSKKTEGRRREERKGRKQERREEGRRML